MDLYQELILDHSKHPQHAGLREPYDAQVHHVNPVSYTHLDVYKRQKYTVTAGTVTLDGQDVLAMSVDERARAGLFLAMQYPVEVPGVSVSNFLRTAKTAIDGQAPKLRTCCLLYTSRCV